MVPFWRALRRWEKLRVAAGAISIAFALMVAAYGFGLSSLAASREGVLSALALIAIGGTGLLYAWRLGAGGLVE